MVRFSPVGFDVQLKFRVLALRQIIIYLNIIYLLVSLLVG